MTVSIRKRLFLWLAVAITLAMLGQSMISYHLALHGVDAYADYHMVQLAHEIRRNTPELSKIPDDLDLQGVEYGFQLHWTPYSADDGLEGPVQRIPYFSIQVRDGKSYRVFHAPTQKGWIEIWHDLAKRQAKAREHALTTIAPILLLAPVLLLISWWGGHLVLRPLVRARQEIAARQPDDLRELDPQGLPDELQPFIAEINTLFHRIETAFTTQQHFVADAAHELRSPLAALRLQVQALQRAATAESRQQMSERLLSGIDRTTRLVEQMLLLAREDAAVLAPAQCDLQAVIRHALSDVMAEAAGLGADISAQLPEHAVWVSGQADALRILLRNLVENAVKYSGRGGRIELFLTENTKGFLLEIEDDGPGISPEDLPRVFDRFYRGQDAQAQGSGLGLSIVNVIALRQRIGIALGRSAKLGGLHVQLQFVFP